MSGSGASPAGSEDGWSAWPAPAKLNLFLHITGRRDDGYHLLQTVFQLLDWGDTVRLHLRDDGRIRRLDPLPGVDAEDDLVVRAARRLQDAIGGRTGVDIAVDKCIPMGGGLGGGSSDAATTLVALNELWAAGFDEDALAALGLGLGADVPVFVRGHSAWAEGVGEQLSAIDLPERWYVIVDPEVHVPTAELFRVSELTRDAAPLTIPLFLSGARTTNAFEAVVRVRFPAVARALDWLADHGEARLSGSGGCVFAAVDSQDAALDVAGRCPVGRGYAARGVVDSPLLMRRDEWRRRAGKSGRQG